MYTCETYIKIYLQDVFHFISLGNIKCVVWNWVFESKKILWEDKRKTIKCTRRIFVSGWSSALLTSKRFSSKIFFFLARSTNTWKLVPRRILCIVLRMVFNEIRSFLQEFLFAVMIQFIDTECRRTWESSRRSVTDDTLEKFLGIKQLACEWNWVVELSSMQVITIELLNQKACKWEELSL